MATLQLVNRAERRGLLRRTPDGDDRRVTWVELTDEGHQLALRTHGDVTARLSALVGRLSRTDQRELTSVVRQLLAEAGR